MLSNGRRGFLKTSLIAGAGVTVAPKAEADIFNFQQGLPTVQLYTNETCAQFKVLVDPEFPVEFVVNGSDGSRPAIEIIDRIQNPYDQRDQLAHLMVTGLRLGVRYDLKTYENGREIDSREFRALDTTKPDGKFALISCMQDLFPPLQAYMWEACAAARPDVLFFIGDASYTDVGGNGTIQSLWRRHMETRRALDVYYWKVLIPIMATWDDHDFAGDNATRYHALNGRSQTVFKAMFAFRPVGTTCLGPGVASGVELFHQRFFLMDDRTWRDPWGTPQGLQWGNGQENWLFSSLATSTKPAWILNGSQFFGAYLEKDSMEGRHPYQFARVMKRLRDIEAPVVFGSGDVHFSELMRIERDVLGYETLEVTSSSMHSFTAPWVNQRAVNPRRIDTTWHYNFVLCQANARSAGRLDVRATSVGKDMSVYFDRSVSIVRK